MKGRHRPCPGGVRDYPRKDLSHMSKRLLPCRAGREELGKVLLLVSGTAQHGGSLTELEEEIGEEMNVALEAGTMRLFRLPDTSLRNICYVAGKVLMLHTLAALHSEPRTRSRSHISRSSSSNRYTRPGHLRPKCSKIDGARIGWRARTYKRCVRLPS